MVKTLLVIAFCLTLSAAHATVVSFIEVQSSASQIVDQTDPYYGWYQYQLDLQWDFGDDGKGISHWDLLLKLDCIEADHLVEFDAIAGYSTTETSPTDPTAMGWSGFFERGGDPTLGAQDPVLKYSDPFYPVDAEPGKAGFGTFYFYSNIIPEYGAVSDAVAAKAGTRIIMGNFNGAYPSCNVIPEPFTGMLMVFCCVLLKGRR